MRAKRSTELIEFVSTYTLDTSCRTLLPKKRLVCPPVASAKTFVSRNTRYVRPDMLSRAAPFCEGECRGQNEICWKGGKAYLFEDEEKRGPGKVQGELG